MAQDFTLNIIGNASITKLADEAHLRIATTATGRNKQEVSDQVLLTAKKIDDMLDEIHNRASNSPDEQPLSHFTKTSLTSNSWLEYVPVSTIPGYSNTSIFASKPVYQSMPQQQQGADSVEQVRQYRSRIEFDIRFQDFIELGKFSAQLTSLDHCEIQSLTWILRPETQDKYKNELRLEVARDAVKKVRDYCQVLVPGLDCLIQPQKLGNEQQSGKFQVSTGLGWPPSVGVQSGSLFGNNNSQPAGGLFGSATGNVQPAQNAADQNINFSPQEISMSLSTEFIFGVKTHGWKPLSRFDTS